MPDARVPDGEQPAGGEACGDRYGDFACGLPAGHLGYHTILREDGSISGWAPRPPRPRPAEPTVDGLAELEALRAVVARVRRLVAFYDRHEYASLNVDDLRRALDGDGG